jgi:hypothetical protein
VEEALSLITKQKTHIELNFDNYDEYLQYQNIYKNHGYKVIPKGQLKNLNDWSFVAEKTEYQTRE